MKNAARFGLLIAGSMLAASCAAHSVRIADIKDQPSRYDHRTVKVTGVVTTSWSIPVAPVQVYNINDGTGEIVVLSQSTRVLSKGARVEVKGRVTEVASLGSQSVGLHLEEHGRTIR
jgi:DNA/RNA endonuclease YhcR with UshA esterase domain